jgi:arginase family enzyme
VTPRVTILLGRTSDRTAGGARGAEALGAELADRLGVAAARVGVPEPPRDPGFEADLSESRPALEAAVAALESALKADERPFLLASDCSICLTTLPALARRDPAVHVVWLDAHGDFNTPRTTASGFLGGMCLAAACGRWESGYGAGLDPRRVVMSDGRDLDPAEREELGRAGVRVVAPSEVAGIVRGQAVFVHLDLDILDPEVLPAGVPAPGGLSAEALRTVLTELTAAATELVGVEITAFEAPEDPGERERLTRMLGGVVEPLLARA